MIFSIDFDSELQIHTRIKNLAVEYLAPVTNGFFYRPKSLEHLEGNNYEGIVFPQISTRTRLFDHSLGNFSIQPVLEKFTIGFYNDDYDLISNLPVGKKIKMKVKIRSISKETPEVHI